MASHRNAALSDREKERGASADVQRTSEHLEVTAKHPENQDAPITVAARRSGAISEAASKNTRGRPPVMSRVDQDMVRLISPRVRTERGKQDVFYRTRALDVLLDDEKFAWLCSRETASTGSWKASILTELGRFKTPSDNRFLAERPKTKDAVRYLRHIRALTKLDEGDGS